MEDGLAQAWPSAGWHDGLCGLVQPSRVKGNDTGYHRISTMNQLILPVTILSSSAEQRQAVHD